MFGLNHSYCLLTRWYARGTKEVTNQTLGGPVHAHTEVQNRPPTALAPVQDLPLTCDEQLLWLLKANYWSLKSPIPGLSEVCKAA